MLMSKKQYLEVEGNVVSVPLDSIDPSPFQTRTVFKKEEIESLAKSIEENGLLQPVSIRRVGEGRYQLIAGERRLRACKLAGLTHISAIICEMDDTISAIFGYIENSQRADLNPFEEARGIKMLMRMWECTQEEAAKRLGMTQPTLCNKLRLLSLTPEQQKICLTYQLTERHARTVLSLSEPDVRTSLLQKAGEKQLSVAELERLVKEKLSKKPKKPKRMVMIKDVRIFVNTINRAISFMRSAGVSATADRTDTEDYIEYVVRIPTAPVKRAANG